MKLFLHAHALAGQPVMQKFVLKGSNKEVHEETVTKLGGGLLSFQHA